MVGTYRRFIFKFNLQLKLRHFICVFERKKVAFYFLVNNLDAFLLTKNGRALVFETFLKCGKLECKSTFDKNKGIFTDDRTH